LSVLLVAAGAAVGAPLRWWIDRWCQARATTPFPWGTLSVNVSGSFVLGVLAASVSAESPLFLLVGIGFCGTFTPFSSFAWETYQLVQNGARLFGMFNVLTSLLCCFGSAWVGWAMTNAIT